MSAYPVAREDRVRLRAVQIRQVQARADREKKVVGRSLKCSGGGSLGGWPERHRGDLDGCSGGPTVCLCECHDGQVAS